MKSRNVAQVAKTAVLAASIGFVATSNSAFAASLTLFHNNDGESKLLGSGSFGGFDYFLGTLNTVRDAASTAGRDVVTVSSGDNFLAGLAFRASQQRRVDAGGIGSSNFGTNNELNYYDALALAAVGYDAITLGNHDFDFGPEVLGDFMAGYANAGGTGTFISSNLDFSAEPALSGFVNSAGNPSIAASTVVTGASGETYGIIGATTETLDNISSPGNNITIGDVATAVQAQVDALEAMGVNKIVLSSHLQGLAGADGEEQLLTQLRGVDIVIAGGGDELLTNAPDANTSAPFGPAIEGPYPFISTTTDLDGKNVAIVTTQGEYRYIGELNVEFDTLGNVTSVNGDTILVDPNTSPQATGLVNGIDVQGQIIAPLQQDVANLAATVVGATDVDLDGRRNSVRAAETNLGNLITDAFVWQAEQIGGLTGDPVIAVTNGGGIRNDSVIAAGSNLTVADVIGILPFDNSVVTLNGFTVADLVSALENSVSRIPATSGGFLQVSGFAFDYNPDYPTGERLREVRLADGTLLWTIADGDVYGGTLDLVTNSFTAAGGDGYDEFARYFANDLGVNYGDALAAFIENQLGGVVSGSFYPAAGLNRINAVPVPATLWLVGLGMLGARLVRRRA